MKILWALVFIVTILSVSVNGDIQCRDENNNPVDWYVVYKLPKLSRSSTEFIKRGKGYMYITSASLDRGWQVSSNPLDTNNTLFEHTLPFLKDTKQEVFWFVYNDQGDVKCSTCGHTKGVVAGDNSSGIWLVHSIPHFINGSFPATGRKNGQSALCISLTQQQLNSVGDLLAYNAPNFQKWNIVDSLKGLYPKIMAAFQRVNVTKPWSLEKFISTAKGNKLHAFAKSRRFGKDLYEWVASSLESNMFVETWINDEHPLPSSCKLQYKVINVQSMTLPMMNLQFTSHKDHSKLAISSSSSAPWICIGDINRAESQEWRGGGTVCINNAGLWHSYQNLINSTEDCTSIAKNRKHSRNNEMAKHRNRGA